MRIFGHTNLETKFIDLSQIVFIFNETLNLKFESILIIIIQRKQV
jgi:hypothetical protein